MVENEKQEAVSVGEQSAADEKNQLTPEQQAKLEEMFKKVEVPILSVDLQARSTKAMELLRELEEEVIAKKDGALEKKSFIQDKIMSLKEFGGITVDENEYKKSEVSVKEFVRLLDHMIGEISRDISFYSALLSDKPPKELWIFKFEPDDFTQYLSNRLKLVKKYVKSARRDLSVSYSRYCYGFDAQIRQIGFIEQYLKTVGSRKKQAKAS